MIDLGNRLLLDDGKVLLTAEGAVEALYAGNGLADCAVAPSEDTELWHSSRRLLDSSINELITDPSQLANRDWYGEWVTPEPWQSADVLQYCLDKCSTDDQRERVCEEMILFAERDMLPVLRHLMWLVYSLRQRGITWGVGRGSSVSSYVLFLIGINRIDPTKFDLDISEFLK